MEEQQRQVAEQQAREMERRRFEEELTRRREEETLKQAEAQRKVLEDQRRQEEHWRIQRESKAKWINDLQGNWAAQQAGIPQGGNPAAGAGQLDPRAAAAAAGLGAAGNAQQVA